MLSVFDQPVMDTNCTRRNSSAVVLQSLAMLNDGFILEQADYLAERVIRSAGDGTDSRINEAFRIILGRQPTAKEASWSAQSFHQLMDRFRGAGDEPGKAGKKALAALCHTLLNTNEFLYVE
jgi:hypothetical protein